MALEDAVLLSTLLSRLPTSSEEFDQTILSSLLDEFCKLRYPRVEALKAKSRENGDAYALPTSKGERRTDGSKMETAEISVDVLQAMVSSHFLVNASIRDVLFGYDAETAASGTCSSEVKLG
jgi:2-polyprenyl-6-methoxyphenol hydroxylase-like FAD-dependent oxidoreductase